MPLLFVILAVVLLVAAGWFSRRRFLGGKRATVPQPGKAPVDGDDFEDFNEKFLRNPSGKQGTVELVRAYHSDDLMLLRSLLDAEGVESFVQPSSLGNLYPTVATVGFGDSIIVIYQIDQESGRRVVHDFLQGWEASGAPGAGSTVQPVLLLPAD